MAMCSIGRTDGGYARRPGGTPLSDPRPGQRVRSVMMFR
jgi:hypothetical protein